MAKSKASSAKKGGLNLGALSNRQNGKGLGRGLSALLPTEGASTSKINIQLIDPNPYQPRVSFHEDALHTLVDSIKQYGLVQPIIVRKVDERYQLVAGERRWRACKELGMKEIEAIVKDYSTEQTTEIALVENLQRQDLDPIEEACAYQRLMDTFRLTQEAISVKVGRSRSHVANMVRLLKLSPKVKDELSAGEITVGQARPLLALETAAAQEEALAVIFEKELTARQVEALVHSLLQPNKERKTKKSIHDSAEMRAWADRIKVALGTPVGIRFRAGKAVKGKIEIQFTNEDELVRLLQYLEECEGTISAEDILKKGAATKKSGTTTKKSGTIKSDRNTSRSAKASESKNLANKASGNKVTSGKVASLNKALAEKKEKTAAVQKKAQKNFVI